MGVYLRLISGVFPWTVQIGFAEQTSGGAALTYDMSGSLLPTTAALATQRFSTAQTLIYAQTVGIAPMLWLYSQQSGQAVDVTFRIAGIQVEQGGTATSYIPTIGTSQTRGAAIGTEVVRQAVHPTGLENSARNWIRNGDATGAVVGNPGTSPTNWSIATVAQGISRQIVATGTESGLSYVDIRFSGTATGTFGFMTQFGTNTEVPALFGQAWTASVYVKLVAGTVPGGTNLSIAEKDSSGGSLSNDDHGITQPTTAGLITQRVSDTRTLSNASTAYVVFYHWTMITNGQVVDFTLRFAAAQLEHGSTVTAYRPTSGAISDTRGAALGTLAIKQQIYPKGLQNSVRNWIRNSTMVGAAGGSPGTAPTNWSISSFATGVSLASLATGMVNGQPYLDMTFAGTNTGAGAWLQINFDLSGTSGYPSRPSDIWTISAILSRTGDAPAYAYFMPVCWNAGGTFVGQPGGTNFSIGTTPTLQSNVLTTAANTAFVQPSLVIGINAGASANMTVRITQPQAEPGAVATTSSPTEAAASGRPRQHAAAWHAAPRQRRSRSPPASHPAAHSAPSLGRRRPARSGRRLQHHA